MNAVRERGPGGEQSKRAEHLHVVLTEPGPDELDLLHIFGGVGMQSCSSSEPGRDRTKQRRRTGQRQPRRECVAQAIILRTVPLLCQPITLPERVLGGLAQAVGNAGSGIHHRLAGAEPDAELARRLEHRVVMVHCSHVENAGRSSQQQFGDPELGAGAEARRRVRRLERPDSLPQPGQQGSILRLVAEQHLAEMNVCVHEPGEHRTARRVEKCLSRRPQVPADLDNTSVPQTQIEWFHPPFGVDCDRNPALDEQGRPKLGAR